jgi:3-hydroxybutyryl-CoA dehydrogenase
MATTYSRKDYPPVPDIRTIGIIGAGQMGGGIAQVAAAAGYEVKLTDVSSQQLDAAMERMDGLLDRQVRKGAIGQEAKRATLARVAPGTDQGALGECELVIEAAAESEDLKKRIFQDLVPRLRPDAILASNTSSISITRLAAVTGRPERFIGMHFMNPVPAMRLVELIRGIATEEDTYQAVKTVAERLGKTSVTAEDFPAFIVNRILLPMINEAVYTLYEGVGTVESIDTAMSSARTTRWPARARRLHRPSTPASPSCRCSTTASPTASTGPARCS